MDEGHRDPAPGRTSRIQLPWENRGWFTDQVRGLADPEAEATIAEEAGLSQPYGLRVDRPGLAISPVMNNPYFTFAMSPVFVVSSVLVLSMNTGSAVLSWIIAILCLLAALMAAVSGVMRVAGWHRARRAGRRIEAAGGTFPPELRWYR